MEELSNQIAKWEKVTSAENFWQDAQKGAGVMQKLETLRDEESNLLRIKNNLGEDEIQRAKDFLIGRTKLAMDKTSYWASLIGEKLLLDDEVVDVEKELEKFKKVSRDEVLDLAKDIFKKDEIREIVIKNK